MCPYLCIRSLFIPQCICTVCLFRVEFTQIRIAVKLNLLGELAVVQAEAQDVVRISESATRRHTFNVKFPANFLQDAIQKMSHSEGPAAVGVFPHTVARLEWRAPQEE